MADYHGFEVDDEMLEELEKFQWGGVKDGYAMVQVPLHRLIMKAPRGTIVDHRDGNPKNCRSDNLRFATPSQSSANTASVQGKSSQYKGVYRTNHNTKHAEKDYKYEYWWAKVKKDGKEKKKRFKTELEAALWYDEMAKEIHGEYARLNFPN